ncbi:uncharacterized protein [Centroberyx affinis]|uniref:uncharacterized protein isoform X4 n=1 Tax=Centroberyx affinis TaxID=166261 RepID=UPI003A5B9F3A
MMKLLLSSLLLASLSAPSSWSVSSENKLVVTQSPDVTIKEGETVRIDCCWDVKMTKGRVNWLKNQTTISNESTSFKTETINNSQCQGSLKKKCNCLNLTFSNIMRNESGRYICKVIVEIPQYYQAQGNGTVITVTARHNTANQPTKKPTNASPESKPAVPLPVTVSLAVVASVFLIAIICFWTLKRRRGSARAARVIYEVPHVDSEQAEVDGHSTSSSRGSSQWCQVPVYESFDYFERVEDKGSGSGSAK